MPRLARCLPLIVAIVTAASSALGDTVDPASRSTARTLGREALKLFDAGDYTGALDKLTTANQLVPTPTVGLYAARCLVKLGRLVEASERYLDVSRMQLDRAAPPVMRKALIDAVTEREKLLPTIPTLAVVVEGPPGDGVTVVVDGKALLPGLLGEPRPIDPGHHGATAKRSDIEVSQQADVHLGDAARLVLKLPPLPAPPPPAPERASTLRVAGWVGVGVGAVGTVLGAVSGGIAVSEDASLSKSCPSHVCGSSEASTVSSYHAVTKLTTVGIVAGLAGFGFGVPVLLMTQKAERAKTDEGPTRSTRIEPWISVGGAGLRGSF